MQKINHIVRCDWRGSFFDESPLMSSLASRISQDLIRFTNQTQQFDVETRTAGNGGEELSKGSFTKPPSCLSPENLPTINLIREKE